MLTLLTVLASKLHLPAQSYVVDSIAITGVKKTKPKVILWQLDFKVGDTIAAEDLEALVKRNYDNVYNLGLFTKVAFGDSLVDGRLRFYVDVQERWYIFPTPYVALEERTFNEWWVDKDLDRLVYGGGVEWANFTGWNDRLFIYAQNGYRRTVSVTFRRPFLFPKPQIDGTFSYRHVSNREIGYTTRDGVLQLVRLGKARIRNSHTGSATLAKRLSPRSQIQLSVAYQHFRIHDSIHQTDTLGASYFYLTDSARFEHYPSVAISYINDQRDIRSFPLSGYKYGATFRKLGLPGVGTSSFGKIALTFSHHIPIGKRWNFAYGMQQFILLGKKVPYYDKFFIGFGSFLRGYEPYVIDGSFVNLTKAEWKFAIIPRKFIHLKWLPFKKFQDLPLGLYLSAYSDLGYVRDWTFNNQDNFLKNKLLTGYGVGLNLISIYDSLIRLEYSFNHLGQGGFYLSGLVSIQ